MDKPKGYPKTPELDKMRFAQPDSQKLGNFLEWISEQGWELAFFPKNSERLHSVNKNRDAILHQYFEIDKKKADKERDAVLDWQRRRNATIPKRSGNQNNQKST